MSIWSLQIGDDFTNFCFPVKDDETFFMQALDKLEESVPVSSQWRVLYMQRQDPKKATDFFEIGDTGIIAASEKAVKQLANSLREAELLPLETDTGKYYVLNVHNFVDCLKPQESDCVAAADGTIVSYSQLQFDEGKMTDTGFFKIKGLPYEIFLSGVIEEECEQSGLRGLVFDPKSNLVWCSE